MSWRRINYIISYWLQQTHRRNMNKLRDTLHISLYVRTQDVIKAIQKPISEQEKLRLVENLIFKVQQVAGFDTCTTPDPDEIKNFTDLQWTLDYFSDRWCMSRANRIMAFVNTRNQELLRKSLHK
jgi:hypothetical protein